MKKITAFILSLAFLLCLTSAAAGNGGTAADPLVSLSYIDNTYVPGLLASGRSEISAAADGLREDAGARLDAIAERSAALASGQISFASGYDTVILGNGGGVTGFTGVSFILLKGSARLNIRRGAVINISDGTEVPSGSGMKANVRYFLAEDTEASVLSDGDARCAVSGSYMVTGGARSVITRYFDVAEDSWYNPYVRYVYDRGLYHDTQSAYFRPDESADRATLVYALWRLSGSPFAPAPSFTDLTEDWYRAAVAWASHSGIVKGYDERTFGPGDSVTREQVAVIMYRYAALMGQSVSASADLGSYTDAAGVADWAIKEMRWANAVGLIKGMSDTTLLPQGTATRAQVGAILMRFEGNE